jgi:chitosanase
MITETQKKSIQGIVEVFENGKISKDSYTQVTLITGDTGGLTYGKHQATVKSGSLYLIVRAYVDNPQSLYGSFLKPYLNKLAKCDYSLNHDYELRGYLRQAGSDPIMRDMQDHIFDLKYFDPASGTAAMYGIESGLGVAVVYDSFIHGSWSLIAERTNKGCGSVMSKGEQGWITQYVKNRRNWLMTHSNSLLHKTVYRMDAFLKLIQEENWNLDLPFYVRGIKLDELVLGLSSHPNNEPNDRILKLTEPPYMRGADVTVMQSLLKRKGFLSGAVDGIFGPRTEQAVRFFQFKNNLKADGIFGPLTREKLNS